MTSFAYSIIDVRIIPLSLKKNFMEFNLSVKEELRHYQLIVNI
jgi:hypothetical protein